MQHNKQTTMPKQTLGLILGLFIIAVLLFIIALSVNNNSNRIMIPSPIGVQSTPTPIAHTVLSLTPGLIYTSSQSATVTIHIDSGMDTITAVQTELSFDPKTITSITIQPGTFFINPLTLFKDVNYKTGRLSYAVATQAGKIGVSGSGTIATLVIRTHLTLNQQTLIQFLPMSLVTARNISQSLLKNSAGTSIIYSPSHL